LPIEYYEFTRGIEWIVPHHNLPWDSSSGDSFNGYSAFPASAYSQLIESNKLTIDSMSIINQSSLEGKPLTPMEYRSIFEVKRNFVNLMNLPYDYVLLSVLMLAFMKYQSQNQDMKPEAELPMISQKLDGYQ
jgi:hypothetical protein